MNLKINLISVAVVNIPLISYLAESFLAGKDINEKITITFGVLLSVIYLFQSLCIIYLAWQKINIKKAYPLLLLNLILAFVGILNSDSVFYTCIVFLKYFSLILFSLWLSYESLDKIRSFIIYGCFGSLLGFALFAVLHFYLSNGDFLFTLAQIQLPAFFLLYLFTYNIYKYDLRSKLFLHLAVFGYLLILLLGGFRASDLQQFRFQYLPLALFFIIAFLLLPKNILRIALFILIVILISNTEDIVEILLYRLGSFEERISILHVMAIESFYFLVPQGLGASDKLFDINSFTVYAGSGRALYPPHSSFASMLFDSSIFFFIFVVIFYINLFRKMKADVYLMTSSNYFSEKKIPFLIIFFVIYFFENIFYLKFSITGATFSDDSLYVFVAMIFFYYKCIISRFYCAHN